ncbi:hypothetical protein ACHQM5_011486 [Ranunculus cassubicifolius]
MSLSKEEGSIQVSNKERNFRAIPPVYAPCFFISHGKKYRNQTFCIPSDGSYHVRSVPEMRGMRLQDVRLSSPMSILEDNSRSFIVENNGEIYSIFVGFVGSPVHVYKFDQSKKKMKWLKLDSLGDRLMFLSHSTSLLLPAVLKGTENRIYLPRFKGSSSVFYSLSSGKYHSFREQEPRRDWIGTCEHWNCTWFQYTM